MSYSKCILTQTLRTFLTGFISSAVFSLVINIEVVFEKPKICFLLLLTSLLLFTYIRYHSLNYFYRSHRPSKYFVGALVSYVVYGIVAYILYHFRMSGIYNLVFLPTRFLEAFVYTELISFGVAHLIAVVTIFFVHFNNMRIMNSEFIDY